MTAFTEKATNAVLVAYCRAKGIPPTVEAVRERDGNFAEYMCWVGARRREWMTLHKGREPVMPRDEAAWIAHCEKAAVGVQGGAT